jgi:hypothetical protein
MRVVAGVVVAGMAILGGGAFYWFVGRDLLNPPDVRQCEWIVKKQLKTPATYQRAALSRGTAVDGAPTISISFDAQNSFGALLRGAATCQYLSRAAAAGDAVIGKVTIDGEEVDPAVLGAYTSLWEACAQNARISGPFSTPEQCKFY